MRLISLYSGAGGLDLGFAKAGFMPVFSADINRDAVETYRTISKVVQGEWKNAAVLFENCDVRCGDVLNESKDLSAGDAEIVIGGPPCQGFSVGGKMDPEDPRIREVFHFLDVVKRVRPFVFVMENVEALATNVKWAHIREKMEQEVSGFYHTNIHVLNAADYGVPQLRRRMFFVGMIGAESSYAEKLKEMVMSLITSGDALRNLPKFGQVGNNDCGNAQIVPAKNPILRKSPYSGMLFNGHGRVINLSEPAPTIVASLGGNRTPIVDEKALRDGAEPWILQYHRKVQNYPHKRYEQMLADSPLRRITVEEAACLQSFPDDLKFAGYRSSRYSQIGNAVPPMLAYALANAIMADLK